MTRFALFVPSPGGDRDRVARLQAAGLRAYPLGEAVLWASTPPLRTRTGAWAEAIVGQAFRGRAAVRRLSAPDDAHRSGGDVADLWGNFVAIEDGPAGTSVYRDPSGGGPAYLVAGGAAVCSDVATLVALEGKGPAIDWPGVAAQLRYPRFRGRRTGLGGVREILPGERVTLGGAVGAMAWRPPDPEPHGDAGTQARDLRHAVEDVVAGWASVHPRLQLELSGGLDSSILAVALGPAAVSARAATFVTQGADGDELPFARAAATAAGLALHEVHGLRSAFAVEPPDMRPLRHGLLGGFDHAMGAAASDWAADVLLSGAGGDSLFGRLASAAPVVDAWRLDGMGAAVRAVRDIAAVTRTPLSTVTSAALRRALRPRAPRDWPRDDRFLAGMPCAFEGHPWLDAIGDRLPGRRAQVAATIAVHAVLDGFARGRVRPLIAPLMARPVLEACLRIPVWRTYAGRTDRAMARAAFGDRLPALVRDRRGKGRFGAMIDAAFEAQRPALRDLLLDGQLVAAGIIDRASVETALGRSLTAAASDHVRLGEIADVELWVRGIGAQAVPLRA